MNSLKQEMRQLFDKKNGYYSDDPDPLAEEGLLEKITNLALANVHMYDSHRWTILVLSTQIHLQRLYRIVKDPAILLSSAALLISGASGTAGEELNAVKLLSLSVRYASKYYFIDFHEIQDFDSFPVVREFAMPEETRLSSIFCLGRPGTGDHPALFTGDPVFSDILQKI